MKDVLLEYTWTTAAVSSLLFPDMDFGHGGRLWKKKKERFAARASGNVLASDGTRINEGRRRFLIIKRNQYYRTGFTHQLPKTKGNRKETPHHLIQLIRANFLRYEGRCHQRHQQKSHCFVEKPNKIPCGTTTVTIRLIISRRHKANTFFVPTFLPNATQFSTL